MRRGCSTHRSGAEVELDGLRSSVVGIVENPEALDEEFALAAPSADETPHAATILLHATEERVESFRPTVAPTNWNIEGRGQSEKTLAAVGVMITATVAMLLVTLVAAAAFVVIAQRRQRQLGLLAAAGATERDVRLVMIADGAGVGIVAAVAGSLVAFAAWIVVGSGAREGHRPPPGSSRHPLVGGDRRFRPRRDRRRRGGVVAGADDRPAPDHVRALGTAAASEAVTTFGRCRLRPARRRRRLPHVRSRSVEGHRQRSPRHHRRDRDDVRARADRATGGPVDVPTRPARAARDANRICAISVVSSHDLALPWQRSAWRWRSP